MKAVSFTKVSLSDLVFMPPRETIKWAFGTIKLQTTKELVISGPTLLTCFKGCKYNKICFEMPRESEFRQWLEAVSARMEEVVRSCPEAFKANCKNADRFVFEPPYKFSSDSSLYSDELRCKFPPKSILINALDGVEFDPNDLERNTPVRPIIKLSYYRHGDKFGLVCTLIKGYVYERQQKVDDEYELDDDVATL